MAWLRKLASPQSKRRGRRRHCGRQAHCNCKRSRRVLVDLAADGRSPQRPTRRLLNTSRRSRRRHVAPTARRGMSAHPVHALLELDASYRASLISPDLHPSFALRLAVRLLRFSDSAERRAVIIASKREELWKDLRDENDGWIASEGGKGTVAALTNRIDFQSAPSSNSPSAFMQLTRIVPLREVSVRLMRLSTFF